jgi:hypothetical protein
MKDGFMFVIEMDDERLLDDVASFLEYKLPGVVTREGDRLAVTVDGTLALSTQERILQRLIWAWRVERKIDVPTPPRVRHVEQSHAGYA